MKVSNMTQKGMFSVCIYILCVYIYIEIYTRNEYLCILCMSILCTTTDVVENSRIYQKEFSDLGIISYFSLHFLQSQDFLSI
jgi:hypothetical protein